MTMTADHTPTAIECAQERMEAALAEMHRLNQELQALPAQEQEALRRGDEEAARRIPVRRRILERQGRGERRTRPGRLSRCAGAGRRGAG